MKKLFFAGLVILFFADASAQWQWQNPSQQGGLITRMQFLDEYIGYAAQRGNTLLKTTNKGQTWINMPLPFSDAFVMYFLNENTGWCANYAEDKIFRTDDGGLNWNLINDPGSSNTTVYDIWFVNQLKGFRVGYFDGSYAQWTSDGGSTWTNMSGYFSNSYRIFFLDENIGFITSSWILKKTINGGVSWTNISIPAYELTPHAIFALDQNNIFIGGSGMDFYGNPYNAFLRTSNGGGNWIYRYFYDSVTDIYFKSSLRGWVCAGNLFSTLDGGAAFDSLNIKADRIESVLDAAWISRYNTITFSPDEWQTSIPQIKSIYDGYFKCGTVYDTSTIVACGSKGIIAGTFNGGKNWDILYDDKSDIVLNRVVFNGNDIWAVGSSGTILKSSDQGNSWTKTAAPYAWLTDIAFTQSGKPLVTGSNGSGGQIYSSSDGGNTWYLYAEFPEFTDLMQIEFSGGTGWIGTNGCILKSINDGLTWDRVYDNIYLTDMDHSGDTSWFASFNKVVRTTDKGQTWEVFKIVEQGTTSNVNLSFVNSRIGYVSVYDGRMFKTADGGETWTALEGPSGVYIKSISFASGKRGWIFGDFGIIIKYDADFIDVKEPQKDIPSEYYISNPYPNPFNPSTRIGYTLPHPGHVIIIIYDALGREVEKLIDEVKPAGSYDITWNAEGLTSGIYFCRILLENFSETRKIVLAK